MLQRQLSRKVKFSANWQKQKRKIRHHHTHIANIRRDYLHNVTSKISKNHAMIVIEDFKVSNMSKSAKDTAEQHGRNVKAKSGLNRSMLDQGLYEMRRQLEYKQLWRAGQVWRYLRHTPTSGVPAVVIQQKRTACHKVDSGALNADIVSTPISTVLVTF